MSKINVDTWEPESGTAATLMATGDTVTVPSGAELDIASGATLDVNGTIDITGATATGFPSAGFSDVQFLTASQTYTVPSDITKIVIDLISAGGGGGGSDGNWPSAGSAGSNAIKSLAVSVGQTYTLTIAAAGAGGTSSGSGGDGGTASFVNASGTTVNLQCTGGGGGVVNGAPGAGGAASGGDLHINGARSSSGVPAGQSAWRGASTRWGFSGGMIDVSTTSAQDGVGYGAGGCSAYYVGTSSSVGADGRPGLCVIWEYK